MSQTLRLRKVCWKLLDNGEAAIYHLATPTKKVGCNAKENNMSNVYIIRNKETLVQWVAKSGKRSWAAPAHAKNAFAYSGKWQAKDPLLKPLLEEKGCVRKYKGWNGKDCEFYTSLKFSEQDVYELVELQSDADRKVMLAAKLLEDVVDIVDNLPCLLEDKINAFLKDLK